MNFLLMIEFFRNKQLVLFILLNIIINGSVLSSIFATDMKVPSLDFDSQPSSGSAYRDLRSGQKPRYSRGDIELLESSPHGLCMTDSYVQLNISTEERSVLNVESGSFLHFNLGLVKDGRYQIMEHTIRPSSPISGSDSDTEDVPKDLIPESIVGGDDNRMRVFTTTEWPYRIHGHIIMEFINGNRYVGSGTMVGPHHVLTAGHNIYSHSSGEGWATSVEFICAQSIDIYPFGRTSGKILLSVPEWIHQKEPKFDMGMVILGDSIGYKTGWAGVLCGPDLILENHEVHVTGYPGDKGDYGKKSTEMWTMSNTVNCVDPEQLTYAIDTYKGQSGGGVWSYWEGYKRDHPYLVGIHTYGGLLENTATRITFEKFDQIVRWINEYHTLECKYPSFGVPVFSPKLENLMNDAANGNAKALCQLGFRYKKGSGGVDKNPTKAVLFYERAAEQKNASACLNLAISYERGEGVKQNYQMALEWYTKAANLGNTTAKRKLHKEKRRRKESELRKSEKYKASLSLVESLFKVNPDEEWIAQGTGLRPGTVRKMIKTIKE